MSSDENKETTEAIRRFVKGLCNKALCEGTLPLGSGWCNPRYDVQVHVYIQDTLIFTTL